MFAALLSCNHVFITMNTLELWPYAATILYLLVGGCVAKRMLADAIEAAIEACTAMYSFIYLTVSEKLKGNRGCSLDVMIYNSYWCDVGKLVR